MNREQVQASIDRIHKATGEIEDELTLLNFRHGSYLQAHYGNLTRGIINGLMTLRVALMALEKRVLSSWRDDIPEENKDNSDDIQD